jgi:DUF971 family protein
MVGQEILVVDAGGALAVTLADGRWRSVTAETLWLECPSAKARRRRIDARIREAPRGVKITHLAQVGAYGINIAFSDGQNGGVFPWPMLIELCLRPQVEDFISPAQ